MPSSGVAPGGQAAVDALRLRIDEIDAEIADAKGNDSSLAAAIQANASDIATLAAQQASETLDSDPDIEWAGAMLQGGAGLPAGSAELLPTGNGNKKRYVAAKVAEDDTKRAAWGAQSATTPYVLPTVTSTPSLPSGTNGTAGYSFTHTANIDLGDQLKAWSIVSGGTDATHVAGMALNATTGVLAGTPNATGTFVYVIQALTELGAIATKICTLVISPAATPAFNLPSVPPTQPAVNVAFSWDVSAYIQNIPAGTGIVFSAVSGLPAHHLAISSAGLITGTPLAADYGSSFSAVLRVTNGAGVTIDKTVTFTIPAATFSIITTTLPPLQQGQAMTPTTIQTSGGTMPIAAKATTAGTLPAGLVVNIVSGVAVVSGTPTGTGAYSFAEQLTDSTAGTAQTATQTFSGTIAPAATPFAFMGGASTYDLTADLGNPKSGDAIDKALMDYVTGTPANTPIFDSGSPPTTPAFGLDVVGTHYKGTANKSGTANPVLRASDDLGASWKAVQCHLTLLTAGAAVDVYAAIIAAGGQVFSTPNAFTDDDAGRLLGKKNLNALLTALASAASQSARLKSTAGTYWDPVAETGAPIFVPISRDTFGTYIASGSGAAAGLAWFDLGNVIWQLVGGQPVSSAPHQLFDLQNPGDNSISIIRFDARGGSQAEAPAAGSGAAGFYGHGILVRGDGRAHEHDWAVYNEVGVTGSSSGGTSETFDAKFGQIAAGAHAGQCVMLGNWQGDTGTKFASGMVVQQSVETDAVHLTRSWTKVIAVKRRHAFGEYAGAPWGIDNGSDGTDCPRGFYAEAGIPNGNAISSPSLYIGRPGQTANPPTTTRCGADGANTGAVGCTASGAGGSLVVGEVQVNSHHSVNDRYAPYVQQGTVGAASFRIANSTITNPAVKGDGTKHCIQGLAGGGKTAAQNLGLVTVDHATCTVTGLGANNQAAPNVALGAGSWDKIS